MIDEVCPNCEAPFSDLQMMGVGGNQASPRFQCGSIFVPVANRLVVKTYACMKIAELRASIAKPAADVARICTAYEHGFQSTDCLNQYAHGTPEHAAFVIGVEAAFDARHAAAQSSAYGLDVVAGIESADYVSPRLREELEIPPFLRREPPARTKLPCKHCGTGYEQPAAVPADVMAALDRMCTPLDDSWLGSQSATAKSDAHSMKVIRDYILGSAVKESLTTEQPAAVPEAVAKVVMRDDTCPHCKRY